MPMAAESNRQVVPPVGVGPSSVEEHDGGIAFIAPMKRVQKYAGTEGMGESLGSGLHRDERYRSPCLGSMVFGKPFSFPCLATNQ
jgi:hypothetical protein